MKSVVLASLIATAAAFAPASQTGKAVTALNAEKSPAMPFLPYPQNLKGYVGEDIGFDPLRISDYFPMDYLRESEIKHGRICMMAVVGYAAVDLGFVVHPLGQGLSSATAHDAMVKNGVMGNALLWVCLFEMVSYIAVSEMLQGSGREPGDFGIARFWISGDKAKADKLRYNEIMNGRLAMLAFAGMVTQSVLYEKGFPYL